MRIVLLAILTMFVSVTTARAQVNQFHDNEVVKPISVERPKIIPPDFQLTHGWGNTHAERGTEEYSLDSSGVLRVEKSGQGRSKQKSMTIPADQVLDVYWVFLKYEFSKMKEHFDSQDDDGHSEFWRLTANGKTKNVGLMNASSNRIDRIESEVNRILDSVDPKWKTFEESEGRFQRRSER